MMSIISLAINLATGNTGLVVFAGFGGTAVAGLLGGVVGCRHEKQNVWLYIIHYICRFLVETIPSLHNHNPARAIHRYHHPILIWSRIRSSSLTAVTKWTSMTWKQKQQIRAIKFSKNGCDHEDVSRKILF